MVLDESSQKLVSDLKRKRGVVKASLTRIRTFISKFNPREDAISLLEFRQEGLPTINQKFDEIQCQIELIDIENADQVEEEREVFETEYYAIRSEMQEIINAEKSVNSSMNSSASVHRARLAPVSLPKFDGDIQEWQSFFDYFKAMVHEEDAYPPAQKFSYLRSALYGSALDVIKAIPMTELNYNVAIKRLIQRYDNKSLVIQSHIRAILDAPCVESTTARELEALHSSVASHISALETLGQPTDQWDAWLITVILKKLDRETGHEWQLRQKGTDLPKYEELEVFLASRCTAFETSESWSTNKSESKRRNNTNFSSKRVTLAAMEHKNNMMLVSEQDKRENCAHCSGTHRLYYCESFKKLPVSDRVDIVRNARLCFNCFSPAHMADKCNSKYSCFRCKKRHNSLLHFEKTTSSATANVQNDGLAETNDNSKISMPVKVTNGHVFLATAAILVKDNRGSERNCRIVLDSGSQVNFISKELSNKLQLPTKESSLPINGIGATQVQAGSIVEVQLRSRVKNFSLRISCYVLPVIISSIPAVRTPVSGWQIPVNVANELADPGFAIAGSIDLLIGGGSFFDLLEPERIQLATESLYLQGSKFGWVVTGEVGVACLSASRSISEGLEEDWQSNQLLDETFGKLSKNNKRCLEEQQALRHFSETAYREESGRFVLQLPMKNEIGCIGTTLNMATSRFLSMERKLQRDDALRIEYVKFMSEYLMMGHMEEIINEKEIPTRTCYLPHHAIVKASSLTTKVRVVFDASAKGTKGKSLNDVLLCGPTVQEDVFMILSRFRKHQIVIMADVEKMYRQIKIAKRDCDLQRILWRNAPEEELRAYRLLRITYGTAPASFMATQCLVTLAEEYKEEYPIASRVISKDFYMDDLMSGSESEEGCLTLHQQISSILESAGLPLRKWCSNSAAVRKKIAEENEDPLFALEIDKEDSVKSLGLIWKPIADEFNFKVTPNPIHVQLTKRMLLSDLNRVFDPLGFLAPVLVKGKIFLQQLWQMKSDWDSVLSEEIQHKWKTFYTDLGEVQSLKIPRKVLVSTRKGFEIHGFCDASQAAYGACVYVRSQDEDGNWQARLLCARSRIAPLKGATIPRLELSGALCLSQLISKVSEAWDFDCHTCRLWTDSTIVLGWLNAQSRCLKVYVANRVSQILENTNASQWSYVYTADNPADIISRGINIKEIVQAELWWKGPTWLSTEETEWIRPTYRCVQEDELPEQRPVRLALLTVTPIKDLVNSYSNWDRLIRAVGWMVKFVEYLASNKKQQTVKYLTVQNLRDAERILIKRSQEEVFGKEITDLQHQKPVPPGSSLKSLNPSLRNGLIVVGGRLENATISEVQKRPIVLPADHRVTRLIFEQRHRVLLHGGPLALLADVRRQYWPLRGRLIARSVVRRCVDCVRAKPTFQIPLMAPLPKERVRCSRPFTNTGVDFAGPVIIRSGIRGHPRKKVWIAIFVCFSTKAAHIEAVEELTSTAFIAALRRFSARRGKPATIWSDNGTNFVGAQRELIAYTKNIEVKLANEGIDWRFNPPASPHFGGLWESCVKSAKHHLIRVMKQALLTLSELQTLLCQIEACLNSRPLTPLSSEPSDLEPLTPAHFLIGGPITLPPEQDLMQEKLGGLHRWKLVQGILQTFWNRWRNEYLPQQQVRGKWRAVNKPLKVNDVVIVKEENMAPTKWKMAIITSMHPGKDGHVRVVTIRMANGTETKRPVVKLCLLPTESDLEEIEG